MNAALPPGCRIIEGVMTTLSESGECNIAPMGPIVDAAFTQFIFRPFKTSSTYRNLKQLGQGVFHVTDDARLIARAAVGQVQPGDEIIGENTRPASQVKGLVLTTVSRYYELSVQELDDREDRTRIVMRVVASEHLREFFGFNRAMHAVIEAAILATRLHLTGPQSVLCEFDRLQVIVDKTGCETEHQALDELRQYVNRKARETGSR